MNEQRKTTGYLFLCVTVKAKTIKLGCGKIVLALIPGSKRYPRTERAALHEETSNAWRCIQEVLGYSLHAMENSNECA